MLHFSAMMACFVPPSHMLWTFKRVMTSITGWTPDETPPATGALEASRRVRTRQETRSHTRQP